VRRALAPTDRPAVWRQCDDAARLARPRRAAARGGPATTPGRAVLPCGTRVGLLACAPRREAASSPPPSRPERGNDRPPRARPTHTS